MLYAIENEASVLYHLLSTVSLSAFSELSSDEAVSLSRIQGQSSVGGRAEPDGRRREGRRGQTRLLNVLQMDDIS